MKLNEEKATGNGLVPDSTFFCLDSDRNIMVGAVNIRHFLNESKKLGIDRVLMVCDKNNVGSAKSIINNGGVLENEVVVNGIVEQRYWIENR